MSRRRTKKGSQAAGKGLRASTSNMQKRFAELSLGNSILSNELQQAHAWVEQRRRAAQSDLESLGGIQVRACARHTFRVHL